MPREGDLCNRFREDLSPDRRICKACGECVEACVAGARHQVGRYYTVEELLAEVKRDWVFSEQSNGGVTVSGGEPSLQAEFVTSFLKACKEINFHTALDTCGYCEWSKLEAMLLYTDLVLFDLKHSISDTHQEITGVTLTPIVESLMRVNRYEKPLWIRIPIISGINDEKMIMDSMAEILKGLRWIKRVELLPYHPLWVLTGTLFTVITIARARSGGCPLTIPAGPYDLLLICFFSLSHALSPLFDF